MLGTVTDAVRSVVAPAVPVADQAETPIVEAPNSASLYEADEIPPVEQIEAAAREYERGADQARRTDRGERTAKKVLDKLPASTYGTSSVPRPRGRPRTSLRSPASSKPLGLGPRLDKGLRPEPQGRARPSRAGRRRYRGPRRGLAVAQDH